MSKVVSSCCFLLLLCCLAGCQTFTGGGGQDEDFSPLHLYARSKSTVLKKGEPLLVEVFLTNTSDEMIPLNELNAESLTFYAKHSSLDTSVKVVPIFSPKEPMVTVRELDNEQLLGREFVFTRLTEEPGEVRLVVSYESDPSSTFNEVYFASAKELVFQVSQEVLFQRDLDGVLLESEAVRIAREYFSQPENAEVKSRLLENEVGFLDWMVVFNPSNEEQAVGCLVNPYLGTVRTRIDPARYREKKQKPVPKVYNQARQ